MQHTVFESFSNEQTQQYISCVSAHLDTKYDSEKMINFYFGNMDLFRKKWWLKKQRHFYQIQ